MMPYPLRFVKLLLLLSLVPGALTAQEGKASLTLAANGTTEAVVYRGWPLLVEVQALLDEGESAQLQWPSPVRLTIRYANAVVTWPLQFSASPDGMVTITGDRSAGALWTLSAEATSALSTGDYTMRADHSAIGASQLILLTVSDEPADLTREQGSLKTRLRSRYEELTGTREAALQMLTDWLATTPDDIAVLGQKSDLLADMERLAEALDSAELALQAFREQFKQATHPPMGLLRRIRTLEGNLTQP
jgi:hypothetical protein